MSLAVHLAFLLVCVVVVVVPCPTVTLIMANRLRHGRRAGMLNVAGTQQRRNFQTMPGKSRQK